MKNQTSTAIRTLLVMSLVAVVASVINARERIATLETRAQTTKENVMEIKRKVNDIHSFLLNGGK